MKAFFKVFAAASMVLGLGALAHAGVRHAGPASKAGDEYISCLATNVGKSLITVKFEVLDLNGATVATETRSIEPGDTLWLNSIAPTAAVCRFTSSGSTKSLLASLCVRENGGGYQTRAALPAQ